MPGSASETRRWDWIPTAIARAMTGPGGYWRVDDINTRLELLRAAGGTEQQAVRGLNGGKLIAKVKDGDGTIVGLIQSPSLPAGAMTRSAPGRTTYSTGVDPRSCPSARQGNGWTPSMRTRDVR